MFEQNGVQIPDILHGPIILDLETKDPLITSYGPGWAWENRGYIAGIAIQADNFAGYLPIRHQDGQNMDREKILSWLSHNLNLNSPDPVVAFNATYDIGWLRREGVLCSRVIEDAMLQAPLLDEHKFSYSLDALSKEYLGETKNELILKEAAITLGLRPTEANIKSNLWRMPIEVVGKYALKDVNLTGRLWTHFNKLLGEEDLTSTYHLERDLIPLMIEMRWRGVRVDLDEAEVLSEKYRKREEGAIKEIRRRTGIDLTDNLSKSGELAKVLDHEGIPYPTTEKTNKPSITKDLLATLKNETCSLIRTAQKFHRFRTLFVENYVLDIGSSGFIHCQFNQLKSDEGGTVSGRFSCTDPNLQQIPSNDKNDPEDIELGTEVRGLFLARDESVQWMVGDYSQQEPRWMVEMAHRAKIKSAAKALNIYLTDPKTDFHQMTADLTGLTRKQSKPIGLGLAYAMGGAKLALKLGLPIERRSFTKNGKVVEYDAAGPEAQVILDKYDAAVPFVKELDRMCRRVARDRGYIKTPNGRKFHFKMVNGERFRSHKAMNALIQGVSAEETKMAMLLMWKEGIVPALTIHDELDFDDISSDKEAITRREIMLTALPKDVPSKVDIEMGPAWGRCVKRDDI